MQPKHTRRARGDAKENTLLALIIIAALAYSIALCVADHIGYERYLASPKSHMSAQEQLDHYMEWAEHNQG